MHHHFPTALQIPAAQISQLQQARALGAVGFAAFAVWMCHARILQLSQKAHITGFGYMSFT